jgi:murein DD-endopeptidase MepM/ murein hydrolase activator NlpD
MTQARGTFLDKEIFFVPVSAAGFGNSGPRGADVSVSRRATDWSGWSVVPLDQKPGGASVEVAGTVPGGAELRGRLSFRIAAKKFPEQRLTVDEGYVTPPPEVRERIERETRRLAAVYATRTPSAPPTGPFVRPVEGEPTGVFGTRRIYNGKPRSPHPGLDLRAATGTEVHASGPGVIVLAADLYFSGNTVIVDHGGGLFTIYGHLSRTLVREGETVEAGRLLGLSGSTGRVTGPHLHWGAKIGELPFDPTALLDPSLFG